jgi:putative RNA 2'-phosphotransferase
MTNTNTSKFISLILRHHPEKIGITLDEHGWADVDELINGIAKTRKFDMAMLEEIVATDNKGRYSFNDDKTLIRANQGHSIPVDVELEKVIPPEILYHGSAQKYEASISEQGLIPKSRLYVHLSKDYDTAYNVGKRHGKPIVYKVLSKQIADNGYDFFLSVNGVWLTKSVPVEYLQKIVEQNIF